MIDQTTENEIKSNIDIVEVLSDFLDLKKEGQNYKCLSPFTSEKTPSFTVFPNKNNFKDFSSGLQGDAITFLREYQGFTYPEVLKYLAEKYNIPIQQLEVTDEQRKTYQENESMLIALANASQFFKDQLPNSPAEEYLKSRGIDGTMIERFSLGFAPDAWNHFSNHSQGKFSKHILLKAGLLSQKENSEHTYERFRNRLLFPIQSHTGKVLGFGARALDESKPKYLNSPDSIIYQKSKLLYGLFQAKQAIQKADNCFLVEGYTDVIALHQIDLENVVASCGTSLSFDQLRLISRFTKNITLLRDGDRAGQKATLSQINLILAAGLNISIVELPNQEDPDSYSKKVGKGKFKEYLNNHSHDFVKFILEKSGPLNKPAQKAETIRKIAYSLALVSDQTHQKLLIRDASQLLREGISFMSSEISKAKREIEKVEEDRRKAHGNKEVINFFSIQRGKYGWDIHINEQLFIRFLKDQGFRKFKRNQEIRFLRIQNNILTEHDLDDFKEFIKAYVASLPEIISKKTITAATEYDLSETIVKKRNDLLRTFIRQGETLINEAKLGWLPSFKGELLQDTKDATFFLFKNGFVEVKLQRIVEEGEHEVSIRLRKYEDLQAIKKYVWSQHIKGVDISILPKDEVAQSDFSVFLYNQSKYKKERLKGLMGVLGYLIHRYKNPSYPKVPIITDEGISFGEEGGSGKGLLFKALSYIRKVERIDGKKFNPRGDFAFQRITAETDIIFLDDVKENFDFKYLFSDSTEGVTVNPKGKPEFQLPFEESPKFAISTNYIIEGDSGSFKRRIIELEIYQHYSSKHEPVNDFGKLFFLDWTTQEWNQFYNLFFHAVVQYFHFFDKTYTPRIKTAGINITYKKFLQKTAQLLKVPKNQKEFIQDYVNWLQENLPLDERLPKKDLFNRFVNEFEDLKEAKLTQNPFTKWISEFARFNEWSIKTFRSNGKDYIQFTDETQVIDSSNGILENQSKIQF